MEAKTQFTPENDSAISGASSVADAHKGSENGGIRVQTLSNFGCRV